MEPMGSPSVQFGRESFGGNAKERQKIHYTLEPETLYTPKGLGFRVYPPPEPEWGSETPK